MLLTEKISKIQNVSGAEANLYSLIDKNISKENFDLEYLSTRSVLIKNKEKKAENIISISLDVPGFVLVPKNGKSYLLPTFAFDAKKVLNKNVLVNGKEYKVFSDEKEPERCEELFIKEEFSLGTHAKLYSKILFANGKISGFYASQYFLLSSIIEYLKIAENFDTDIFLASQTRTKFNSFCNFLSQNHYKNALTVHFENTKTPKIFIRCGAFFGSEKLISQFDNGFFEKAVRQKGFSSNSPKQYGISSLDVSIPVSDIDTEKETVTDTVIKKEIENIFSALKNTEAH